MKKIIGIRQFFIFVCLFAYKLTLSQVEVVIQPGPDEGKDAYINTYYSSGNGSTQSFIAAAWTYSGMEGIGRSFLHFKLPELPSDFINFKAEINLFHDYSSQHVGHGGDNACILTRVIENWEEDEINWNNQPEVSFENAVYIPTSETEYQDYPNIDISELILDMYHNPEMSFGLRISLVEENIYRSMILASSDHPDISIRPSLVIRYDTCKLPENHFIHFADSLESHFTYSDTSVTSLNWDFGNGYGSGLQNPIYTYLESGTYQVCLEAENQCGTIDFCDSVTVCDIAQPDFEYQVSNLNATFVNLTVGNFSYYWDFGNGFYSFLSNTEFRYDTCGTYNVCLSVTDDCRTTTKCHNVQVANNTNGILNEDQTGVLVFPNPTTSEFVIKINNLTYNKVEILNNLGEIIRTERFIDRSSIYHVSLSQYPKGIYFLRFYSERGSFVEKLILN